MGNNNRVDGNLYVNGTLTPRNIELPAGCVDDGDVASDAKIAATKIVQPIHYHQGDDDGVEAAVLNKVIHVNLGAVGRVVGLSAGLIVAPAGDKSCTIDIKDKTGTSFLSSTITLDSGSSAYSVYDATVDAAKQALAADDVVELVITIAGSTGSYPKGVFVKYKAWEEYL
jgi:hypothetical protein